MSCFKRNFFLLMVILFLVTLSPANVWAAKSSVNSSQESLSTLQETGPTNNSTKYTKINKTKKETQSKAPKANNISLNSSDNWLSKLFNIGKQKLKISKSTAHPDITNNQSKQNYIYGDNYTWNWASPVKSHLVDLGDQYMRVEYEPKENENGIINIEYFDKSFKFKNSTSVELELPLYGGFFNGSDAYYVISGKNNPDESDEEEVIRVTKYNKQWERQEYSSLKGIHTTEPFESLRCAENNNYLFVNTGHTMYKSDDGKNHQASLLFQIDKNTMDVKTVSEPWADSWGNYGWGYISHSFNQFILVDDTNKLVALNHGDANPRSIVMTVSKSAISDTVLELRETNVNVFNIQGDKGDNYTGVTVGGFEYSDENYITAGSSVDQDENFSTNKIRNIFIAATPKDVTTNSESTINWITDYKAEDNVIASTPHLIKRSDDSFLLMWEKLEPITTFPIGEVSYCYINGEGEIQGDIKTFEGYLSDCEPIINSNNQAVWYVSDNGSLAFYSLGDSDKPEIEYSDNSVFLNSISFSQEEVELDLQGKVAETENKIFAKFDPEEFYAISPVWSIENPEIAKFESDNSYFVIDESKNLRSKAITIKPVSVGTTNIIVSYKGVTNKLPITVYDGKIPVKDLSLDKQNSTLKVGENETLKASIKPDKATEKSINWESSNPEIATVSKEGKVSALKEGKVTITATSVDNDEIFDTCEYTITPKLANLTIKNSVVKAPAKPETYKFKVSLKRDNTPLTGSLKTDKNDTVSFNKDGTADIELTGEAALTLLDIPVGANYTIEETSKGDYTVSYGKDNTSSASGTIEENGSNVEITNTYKTGNLKINISLKDKPIKTETYTVKIELKKNNSPISGTFKTDKGDEVKFNSDGKSELKISGEGSVTLLDLPINTNFSVEEVSDGDYTVSYEKESNSGTIAENESTVELVNTYQSKETGDNNQNNNGSDSNQNNSNQNSNENNNSSSDNQNPSNSTDNNTEEENNSQENDRPGINDNTQNETDKNNSSENTNQNSQENSDENSNQSEEENKQNNTGTDESNKNTPSDNVNKDTSSNKEDQQISENNSNNNNDRDKTSQKESSTNQDKSKETNDKEDPNNKDSNNNEESNSKEDSSNNKDESGNNPDENESSDLIEASYAIVKKQQRNDTEETAEPLIVTIGDTITYLIKVTDNKVDPVEKLQISDTIPEGLNVDEGSIDNDGVLKDGVITWDIENLKDSLTVSFKVKIDENSKGPWINQAILYDNTKGSLIELGKSEEVIAAFSMDDIFEEEETGTENQGNNQNKTTVQSGNNDTVLQVDKTQQKKGTSFSSAPITKLTENDELIYRITVKNISDDSVTNVTVVDNIPIGLTITNNPQNGVVVTDAMTGEQSLIWTKDKLAAGDYLVYDFTVKVGSIEEGKTQNFSNTAEVTYDEIEASASALDTNTVVATTGETVPDVWDNSNTSTQTPSINNTSTTNPLLSNGTSTIGTITPIYTTTSTPSVITVPTSTTGSTTSTSSTEAPKTGLSDNLIYSDLLIALLITSVVCLLFVQYKPKSK